MLTAMRARTTNTTIAATSITAERTGDSNEADSPTFVSMLKPISTIPDGDRPLPRPDASALILRMVSMMDRDMAGPFIRSHQKKPSVPKNLIVSAKKS
ncbi:hypothetical protein D3C85_1264280 [compost metagenome]